MPLGSPYKYLSKLLRDIQTSNPVTGQLFYYDGTDLVPTTGLIYDAAAKRLQIEDRIIQRTNSVVLSTTTIAGANTQETIYTGEIDANELAAENVLQIRASGVVSNESASDDMTMRVYIGSTMIEEFHPEISNVTEADWHMNATFTIRSIGTPGSIAHHAEVVIAGFGNNKSGLADIDTTIAENITITVQWDAAKAGNTISIYQGSLDYKH